MQQIKLSRKFFVLVLAVIVIIVGFVLPCPDGLSHDGKMSLVVLAFMFVMWFGEVVPSSVTALAAMFMLPILGVTNDMNFLYQGFVNSIFFFLIGVFGIAAVINKSNIPMLTMALFVKWFGNSTKKLILAFSATAWLISAFMSDIAACALVAGIVIALNKELNFPKPFMKCLICAVPFGSMSGGVLMPISSATNATIMGMVTQTLGVSVNFLQWMIVGVPAGLIGLIIGWICILVIFKPENLDDKCMQDIKNKFNDSCGLSMYDKKTLILVVSMLILWVAGTWVEVLSTAFVAILGFVVMFLPGVNLLTWKDYQDSTPFDIILMLGALFSIVSAMTSAGAIDWLTSVVTGNIAHLDPFIAYIALSIFLVIIRAVMPNGAPIVVLITPGLLSLAQATGIDSMLILITLSIWCQMTYLVPMIDAQWLMTYQSGEASFIDILKVGIPVTVLLLIVYMCALPPLCALCSLV